jgi:hypothetical protein
MVTGRGGPGGLGLVLSTAMVLALRPVRTLSGV